MVSELESVELSLSSSPAITITAITQADDHRDQAGDQQAHVAVRLVAVAVPRSSSGWPIMRVGSSCMRL